FPLAVRLRGEVEIRAERADSGREERLRESNSHRHGEDSPSPRAKHVAPLAGGATEDTFAAAAAHRPGAGRMLRGQFPLNRAERPPNPLNPMAFRATLRDPRGFDHIGWMIRLFGF